MIQEINFWVQLVCGIIVSRGAIAETKVGKKLLSIISKARFCLVDKKINAIIGIIIIAPFFLIFFNLHLLVIMLLLCVWINIPLYMEEYHKKEFFNIGLSNRYAYWLGIAIGTWFFSDNPTSIHPYSWIFQITQDLNKTFVIGIVSMAVLAVIFDGLILCIGLWSQKFINGEIFFVVASIMFFVICPIVGHLNIKNYQDMVEIKEKTKSIFIKKNSQYEKRV